MNRSSRYPAAAAALTLGLLAGSTASAHDYWLEAPHNAAGDTELRLFVGDCLKADEEKRFEATRTPRFEALTGTTATDLRALAKDEAQPLLTLPPGETGALVVLERNRSYIELDAAKFDAYLREEGLNSVRATRTRAGEADKPGRERYTRYLKLRLPGADPAGMATHALGQPLELVPIEDPASRRPGERLHLRVLLDGAALPGAKVALCVRGANGKVQMRSATSDRHGEVAYTLPAQGPALARTVHMRRVTDGDPKADWESLWTSYSFVVGAR